MGEGWTPETRAGSFRSFFETCRGLSEIDFAARFPHPTLITTMSLERPTWDTALILLIAKGANGAPGDVLLGRDDTCDVVVAQAGVSKKHAVLSTDGKSWFIEDLASSNGTKLNGTVLERGEKTPLPRETAVLDFGGVHLTYNTPATLFSYVTKVLDIDRSEAAKNTATKKVTAMLKTPLWNASGSAKTDLNIPVPVIAEATSKGSGRAKKPGKSDDVSFFAKQAHSIAGSPKRMVWTFVVVAAVIGSALVYGRPLAFMIFGESHPEWFRDK